MRLRTLAFSLAPLLAPLFPSSLAHAQAPGEVAAQPVVVAPVVAQPVVVAPVVVAPVVAAPVVAAPVVAAPAAAPDPAAPEGGCVVVSGPGHESVMANRWAVGVSFGSISLATKDAPDDPTGFGVGELALRFRVTPHLELELAGGGGRERTADNHDGDLDVTTAILAARYRFRPEAAWNWFVTAGFGGAAITRHDPTDQERHDATQPLGMLGVGLERRFHHFALQSELRVIGVGKRQDDPQANPPMTEAAAASTPAPPAMDGNVARSGGELTIGLSYYF